MNRPVKIILLYLLLFSLFACQYQRHEVVLKNEPKEVNYNGKKEINLALALSGAGSKGIAHAGVIAAFEKYNIPIDLIVGSSAGSIVGALYADSKNINQVKSTLINVERKDFLDLSPTTHFMRATIFNDPADFNSFRKFLGDNIKAKNFEQLQIPVVAVATDVMGGEPTIFNSGPIIPAIISSCAVPGLFQPISMEKKLLVDGGVSMPVPVEQAIKFKPNITIAVNISTKLPHTQISNNISMLYRSSWITYYQLAKLQSQKADFIIDIDASKYDWLGDLSVVDKNNLFNLGFKAAENIIKNNKRLLDLSRKIKHEKDSNRTI